MTGYLVNFAVYTMAMLGLIFFALMVYKKFTAEGISKTSKSRILSIEETISIAPRKTLYVVNAGNEKFLIAGDVDKTTLISKLNNNSTVSENSAQIEQSITESDYTFDNKIAQQTKADILDEQIYPNDSHQAIIDFQERVNQKPNVLRNMLRKINR